MKAFPSCLNRTQSKCDQDSAHTPNILHIKPNTTCVQPFTGFVLYYKSIMGQFIVLKNDWKRVQKKKMLITTGIVKLCQHHILDRYMLRSVILNVICFFLEMKSVVHQSALSDTFLFPVLLQDRFFLLASCWEIWLAVSRLAWCDANKHSFYSATPSPQTPSGHGW